MTLSNVQATSFQFTVTGVLAPGIDDPTCAGMGFACDGQGEIKIDVVGGESDCYQGP